MGTELDAITVLNVNDNEVGRYTIGRLLKMGGFRVLDAESGAAALELAARCAPDLVVLDVRLPDISGYEVCRRLKSDARTAWIPVLQTSATFVSSEQRVAGLDSGADGYLVQPLEPMELIATVRALLRARRAEEEARAASRRWQSTFDAISDGVCLLSEQGRVLRCNAALARLVGNGPEAVLGRTLDELFPGAPAPAAPDTSSPASSHESSPGQPGAAARSEGERLVGGRWLRVLIDPIAAAAGEPAGAVAVVSDVTERRALEQALRERAADLADADRRKDEFLAMLAHELRNPLSAISTALHLADRVEPGTPQAQRARDVLHRQTRHLARLVDDLLDVSRITRGKIELRRAPVELVGLVQQAVQAARPMVESRGHELAASLPAEPLHVDADATRVAQVVSNLLDNAAKYTERGGHLAVSLEREGGAGEGAGAGDWAELRVSDDGIGMTPESLARVFELFAQVDASLERPRGGLGIGLTLVRRLVEMHGGSVRAESAGLGRGSAFVVRLPLAAPAEARATGGEAMTPAGEGAPAGARSVLVVEDNADAREMLRSLLESWGHRVQVAGDGALGVQLVVSARPDVALVDIGLPGVDGYEVARRVREELNGRGPLLVAMTGYGRPEDRERALQAGFDLHLVKPVDAHSLARAITGRRLPAG